MFESTNSFSKMVKASRFKLQTEHDLFNTSQSKFKHYRHVNTEVNQLTNRHLNTTLLQYKNPSSERIRNSTLSQILKGGDRTKKQYLRKIFSNKKQLLRRTYAPQNINAHSEKENLQSFIRNSICETPHFHSKITKKNQEFLKQQFNKKMKEIKMKKYVKKDIEDQTALHRFQICSATLKGSKHHENQDSLFFSEDIYIICDGHGTNGKHVSQFVSSTAHKYLRALKSHHKISSTLIKNAIKITQNELETSGIDISFSGCTFIAIISHQNTIFTVSVGDSKAILSSGYNVSEISTLHKPDHPMEKQRIESYGGVVKPIEYSKDKFTGPNRIWAPGKNSWGPGLALSRAFGDRAARKYGLITQPDIRSFELTLDEDYLVLGSDGLFDYMKDQEIGYFLKKCFNDEKIKHEDIAMLLAQEAKEKTPHQSDDITCIIVIL